MKTMRFPHKLVECIPEHPEPGVLYISERFGTAVHLCACGCGMEVVTPIKPGRWKITITAKGASLYPSIGNWSFPCRSHYWITDGRVRWAGDMGDAKISAVRRRDKRDIDASLNSDVGNSSSGLPAGPPGAGEMPTSLWLKLRRLFS